MTNISKEMTAEVKAQAQDLLNFIDASPSPWHAVENVAKLLKENGFKPLI
jgi:aspartyl aminopeptidase